MKVTLSKTKKNLQGTNSGVDETHNQINDLGCKEEKINQNSMKKKESNKMDWLKILWNNCKHTNIQIIGMTGREEKEQEIENVFEKINERKLP